MKVKASAFALNIMVVGSGDSQFQLLRFQISAQSYHQLNFLLRARLGKFEIFGNIYYTLEFRISGNCRKELVLQALPIAQSLSNIEQYWQIPIPRIHKVRQMRSSQRWNYLLSIAFWQIQILLKVHYRFKNTDLLITLYRKRKQAYKRNTDISDIVMDMCRCLCQEVTSMLAQHQ